tara:strand:- start:2203 stop:2904 length:702 start_codon:yes stop_codon:yes gene_type:complete
MSISTINGSLVLFSHDEKENKTNIDKKEKYFFIDLCVDTMNNNIIFMLSYIKNFKLILILLIFLPTLSYSQNKQNKYYNPFRISLSALAKFKIVANSDNENLHKYDQGFGMVGEVIYTIDQKAKYEISLETGFLAVFLNDKNQNANKYIIPVTINAYYYFFDYELSPFLGIGFGLEKFDNTSEVIIKPTVGISNKKLKVYARMAIGKNIGNSIEIGISYFFKERPCGCFPQSR